MAENIRNIRKTSRFESNVFIELEGDGLEFEIKSNFFWLYFL